MNNKEEHRLKRRTYKLEKRIKAIKLDNKINKFVICNNVSKFLAPLVIITGALISTELMGYPTINDKGEITIEKQLPENIIPYLAVESLGLYSLVLLEGINYNDSWTVSSFFSDKSWLQNKDEIINLMNSVSSNNCKIENNQYDLKKTKEKLKKLTLKKEQLVK